MIQLTFVTGSSIRTVYIRGRLLTIVSPEMGMVPLTVDLDRIESEEMTSKFEKMKFSDEDKQTLRDLRDLDSEEAMAKDVIKDFQRTGWRLVRRNDN